MAEYKVGIFWYIGVKFITALQKHAPDIRSDITGKVDSDFSHYETWDRYEKFYPLADFATYPQGRIVYDLKRNIYIVDADKCIPNDKIVGLTADIGISHYKIERDEYYRCDRCCGSFLS